MEQELRSRERQLVAVHRIFFCQTLISLISIFRNDGSLEHRKGSNQQRSVNMLCILKVKGKQQLNQRPA